MATEITQIQMGIPGPSGAGVSVADWAALQAIVASSTTGIVTVHATNTGALLVEKADGTDIFKVDTSGSIVGVQNGGNTIWYSDSGTTVKFRIRGQNGHLYSGGVTPGFAVGANAGSTAVGTIVGTDTCGRITVTPGGTGITSGTYATITFASAFTGNDYGVFLFAADSDAAAAGNHVYSNDAASSTTAWNVQSDTALPAAQHVWKYLVVEYEP